MMKIWYVALHEYRKHVINRRFVFGLLSVPGAILLLVGLIFLVFSMEENTTPIGYVDHSGLLSNPVLAPTIRMAARSSRSMPSSARPAANGQSAR